MSCLLALSCLTVAQASDYVPDDYIWTSQSENSSGSMPCGGHDVGMNVWVEHGDLLFYVSKSGFFDENNTLLKAGRWRLRINSKPFTNEDGSFCQRLCLDDGAIYIKGKDVSIRLWADVFSPRVFMEIKSKTKTSATLSYESWRYKDRQITKAESQQCSYKWDLPAQAMTYKDSIAASEHTLTFCHKNRKYTVFDYTVKKESLDSIKSSLYNPIGELAFGGVMTAPDFTFVDTTDSVYASTDYRSWNFNATGIKQSTVCISLYTGNERFDNVSAASSKKRSSRWWHELWQRSFIVPVDKEKAPATMVTALRNYELIRYILACNAYGKWPSKFNGSLFTFDPIYVDSKSHFTPDYRMWGGGTMTAQNQRLLYWPMLKSGDTDMMAAQLDTYLRMLPNAVARTRYYWGHEGASFTEQIENFGLPNPAEYGQHNEGDDRGTERNAWLEYLWDTSLEFCSMALQIHAYNGMDVSKYEEMVRQCLLFYDQHYQYLAKQRGLKALDGDGKLVLYPTSGCETYKMAYNSSSVIAALKTVAEQAIAYCKANAVADTMLQTEAEGLLSRLPSIPLREIDGHTCIAPAVAWARIQNEETPQLYPVWPWRQYGLGRNGIDVALNTYLYDPYALKMRSPKGWKQDNIWTACLGQKEDARRLTEAKLGNGPYRFTAFYDRGFDWTPDINRGGSGMVGLQEMMLQEKPDGGLMLFPSCPDDWNIRFRLCASGNRTVDATIIDGKVTATVKK